MHETSHPNAGPLLEQLPCLSAFLHLRCRPRRWRSPTSSRHMRGHWATRPWRLKIMVIQSLEQRFATEWFFTNFTNQKSDLLCLCNATSSEGTDKGTFSRSASATATSSFSSLRWNEIRSFYGIGTNWTPSFLSCTFLSCILISARSLLTGSRESSWR